MASWWEEREAADKRVQVFLAGADPRVGSAFTENPSDELVKAIATAASAQPMNVYRAVAAECHCHVYFMYHKPRGVLSQPHQRNRESDPCVADSLPSGYPTTVPFSGRLDAESEGLLLFSSDGGLLTALTRPSRDGSAKAIHKVYHVEVSLSGRSRQEVNGDTFERALESMRKPIDIKGVETEAANDVQLLSGHWIRVALTEGRNHQVCP